MHLGDGRMHLGVELVSWPREGQLRERLARAGIPRLLLVEASAPLPDSIGIDEDWVRLPSDERDVAARVQRLSRIVSRLGSQRPVIDPNRMLHRGGATVLLSPAESTVVAMLISSSGTIVGREAIEHALWGHGAPPSAKALDAIVYRLRRRLAGLNLCIRSARGRGFVIYLDQALDGSPDSSNDTPVRAGDHIEHQ
jgi:DNA-binding winged helix-turn-helix (wHTH) protein